MTNARHSVLAMVFAAVTACSIDVTDPSAILDTDLNTAQSAELLRAGALREFYSAVGLGAWESGLIADEFRFDAGPGGSTRDEELLDRRSSVRYEQLYDNLRYLEWQSVWTVKTAVAEARLRQYALPGAREAHVAEVMGIRAFAALHLAETYCPGFPLHTVVGDRVSYGGALSTEQAFDRSLATFDSALALASGTDSTRVLNFLRIGRARTLLGVGRFADAATAVQGVPTNYVYAAEHSEDRHPRNPLASVAQWNEWGQARTVADAEGVNGINFVSAADPRVPTVDMGPTTDGASRLYGAAKYPTLATPITVGSGVEARLIEAEASLRAGASTWLTILNDLRATQITPAMAALSDPTTTAAREDMVFRERAFWLFGTGHRLGDLRRLVRHYNRSAESVFPTATYWRGGSYEGATSIPFHKNETKFTPGITGCTSR